MQKSDNKFRESIVFLPCGPQGSNLGPQVQSQGSLPESHLTDVAPAFKASAPPQEEAVCVVS